MNETQRPRDFEVFWKSYSECPRCHGDQDFKRAASNAWHISAFDHKLKIEELTKQLNTAMQALSYFANHVVYEEDTVNGILLERPVLTNGHFIATKAIEKIGSPDETAEK